MKPRPSRKAPSVRPTVALILGLVLSGGLARADGSALEVKCSGDVSNGWTFTTDAVGDRFLHVIWSGAREQTRVTKLVQYSTNADGNPVFVGTFQDTVEVVLVDVSGGNPDEGSAVEVYSEDWGWHTGTCRRLTDAGQPETAKAVENLRQNLVGMRDTSASNWLRRNSFERSRIIETTRHGKTEQWRRGPGDAVEVVFYRGRVSDVSEMVE